MAYEIHYGGMRGGKTECMVRKMKYVKLMRPKPFLKVGYIAEIDGVYVRIDDISEDFTNIRVSEIEIHKLKTDMNGYVELDE